MQDADYFWMGEMSTRKKLFPPEVVEDLITPTGRQNRSLAENIASLLEARDEMLVCAESCTGGMVAASLASIPGISQHFCGSLVTYRPCSKRAWLGVKKKTIDQFTTESEETVREMALGALQVTPEATWSVSVVGHLGPDAPPEKDGQIFLGIAQRDDRGKPQIHTVSQSVLAPMTRSRRQNCATELVLRLTAQVLNEGAP